jgi:peptide chain release factor 1
MLSDRASAEQLLQVEQDPEMRDLAKDEITTISGSLAEMEEEIKQLLIPKDPEDRKDCIVELRAGTGGDEASIFAGDLYRMYLRFAEKKEWKTELLSFSEGTAGGFKEIIFQISGNEVYGTLKFESGVHRVQRVPATEAQGRIHTSAATVAIMPEADEVDVDLNMADVKKDTYRSSGAGGQHVNKTESAVRLTHLPTGIVVECQEGRSQLKNYEIAVGVLRTRLYERERERLDLERAAHRKSLVSTGDRSAKIRTYNYPQGRVTDHRINLTVYNLPAVMEGDLDAIIQALKIAENAEKLQAGTQV